jgi:hypothetical protein
VTTWTPKTQQSETWTGETPAARVFDPFVFDRNPIFDTGSVEGIWDAKTIQSETWTQE